MPNTQQNNIQNEIEQINNEINLLQGRLKKNEKSLNQFQRAKDTSFSNQRNTKYS